MKQLKILAVNDPAIYAYLHEAKNQITKKWEEEHQVKVILDIIEWNQYKDTLDQEVRQVNGDYDIIMNPGNFWIPELAEESLIIPLESYLTDYDVDGIVASIQNEMKYKNHIYMIPSFSDGHILFYRKDKLKEKGIVNTKKVITIPELKELVRQLEDNNPVIALKSDVSEILLDFIPFLWNRGVEVLDQAPYFSDEEKTILAIQDYLSFRFYCPKGIEYYGNQQVKESIQKGEVVIGISWGGQAAAILNPDENPYVNKIDFMTYQYPCNTTWGFAIAANSKNKEAAINYLTYVTNEENDKLVGRISGGPVRITTYQDKDEQKYCPWYHVQFEMLKNAKNVPKSIHFGQTAARLYPLIHQLFNGKITPNDFIEECKRDINTND